MNITFEELRMIKHQLPTGSVSKIASQLNIEEQTVRNYFGGDDFESGQAVDIHLQPGPNGGIVNLRDVTILNIAQQMISQSHT